MKSSCVYSCRPSTLRVAVGERRLEVVRDVLVELVVLLLGDLRLGPRPQRRGLVDLLVLVGRHLRLARRRPTAPSSSGSGTVMWSEYLRRIVRSAMPDSSSSSSGRRCRMTSVPRVSCAIGFDACSRPRRALSQRTPSSAASPARRVTSVTRSATMNDGVEADAELADQLRVLGAVGGQRLEELARARLGDRADVLDDLLARHADAVVGHGDRARRGLS